MLLKFQKIQGNLMNRLIFLLEKKLLNDSEPVWEWRSKDLVLRDRENCYRLPMILWAPGDLNPEPTDYESGALTVELGARDCEKAVKIILKYLFIQEKR